MNPPSTNDSPDLPQARNTILSRVTVLHAPLACPKTRVRPTRRGRSRYLCFGICYRSTIGPLCSSWALLADYPGLHRRGP